MRTHLRHHPSGFSTLSVLGHLAAMSLLVLGGQELYVALKNDAPLEITVADYIAKKTDAEWVTLKDAEMSLREVAAVKTRLSDISEVYIPVRPAREPADTIHILLSTKDPAIVEAMKLPNQGSGMGKEKYDAVAKEAARLFPERRVTGLKLHSFLSDFLVRDHLAKLNMNLSHDFVVLEEGVTPKRGQSLCMVVGALLIWFFMLCQAVYEAFWRWSRRRSFHRQRAGG